MADELQQLEARLERLERRMMGADDALAGELAELRQVLRIVLELLVVLEGRTDHADHLLKHLTRGSRWEP
jgi:hypothetical protein